MIEVRQSWFGADIPQNCKGSNITIGAGDDGQVIVTSTGIIGEEANDIGIEVIAGDGDNKPLSAIFANNVITVTLGTKGAGALDDAKNTAELVAEEIDDLDGFTAVHTGDGSGVIGTTALKAFAVVGDGETANSYVTVVYDTPGIAGNAFKIVVENGLQDGALAVTEDEGVMTITLGMTNDAEPVPDDTKNTAGDIATEINKIDGFTATAHGTGAEVPDIEDEDEIQFDGGTTGILPLTGGQYGTECPEPFVILRAWDVDNSEWDYYTNIAPNGRYDTNWRLFNLVEY